MHCNAIAVTIIVFTLFIMKWSVNFKPPTIVTNKIDHVALTDLRENRVTHANYKLTFS